MAAVSDAAVLERTRPDGGAERVAYIVPNGAFAPSRLAEELAQRFPPDALLGCYVPVPFLPLTADGAVDVAALQQIPVLEAELIERWEAHLAQLPEIERAAVLVQDYAPPLPALHLADLLPDWKGVGLPQTNKPTGEAVHDNVAQRIAKSRPPACSHGGKLRDDADLPDTLPAALLRAIEQSPNKGAVHIQADGSEVAQTYPALREDAERILGGLRRLGLKPGDKVIFQLDRTQDFIPAFWGCVLGGFIPAPISIATTYDQVNAAVSKLHHAWLALDKPLVLTGSGLAPAVRSLAGLLELDRWQVESVEDLRAGSPNHDWHPSQPDDLAVLLFTSGSTGKPKGVMLSHRNLLSMALGSIDICKFSRDDVTLNWMPLDHVGAISFLSCMAVYAACQQIHVATKTILEAPLRWLDWIEKYRVTISWAPNFAFGLLNDRAQEIASKQWDLSSMRFLVSAGEAVVAKTARKFLQLLNPHGLKSTALRPAFGMSETCSGISWSETFSLETSTDLDQFVEVGPPIPGASFRIVNDEGEVVEEGAIGHLQLRGPSVTRGYYENSEQTCAAFTADGWFRTGDLGFLREGRLTITGRGKDVIIINGVNFYSHEIEGVVEEIPGVTVSFTAACAVRDGSDDTDKLAIFFSTNRNEDGDLKDLIAEIRRRVSKQIGVTPGYLLPVGPAVIPKTEIGKIQRPQLKQRFEAGEFRDVQKRVDVLTANANTLPDWFFAPVWCPKQLTPSLRPPGAGRALIFADRFGLAREMDAELSAAGNDCIVVEAAEKFSRVDARHYRIDPARAEDYDRLVQELKPGEQPITRVFHLWTCDPLPSSANEVTGMRLAQPIGSHSVLHLTKALARCQSAQEQVALTVVSRFAQSVSGREQLAWAHAPLTALAKTVPLEWPQFDCRHVDIDDEPAAQNGARILAETGAHDDREVAYRAGRRYVPRLQPGALAGAKKSALPFKRGGFYILSGGLGGIGVEISRQLLKNFQVHLLVIGRTQIPEEMDWQKSLEQGGAVAERITTLQALLPVGGAVRYEAGDVGDGKWLKQIVQRAQTEWGCELDGIIHLAGAYKDCPLAEETTESWDAAMRAKVEGALALHQLVKDRPGSLFVHFSSAITLFSGAMVGAYVSANRFLETFSRYQRNECRLRSYCYSWSRWKETGMSRGYAGKSPLAARGFQDLAVEQGIQSFFAALHADQPHLFIGLNGGNSYIRRQQQAPLSPCQQLVAFFATNNRQVDLSRLRALALPDRLGISTHCEFALLPNLPLTESGEIDRAALAESALRNLRGGAEKVAPRTETEQKIAQVWQDVLNHPSIGVFDNFFELGGNSLLATQVISRLRDALNFDLPLRTLFENPTVASLADSLPVQRREEQASEAPLLRPIPRAGELPLSFAQQRLWFMDRLEPSGAADNVPCAFRIKGPLNFSALERALEEIIRRHETLRTTFPSAEGRPRQVVSGVQKFSLPIVDLVHLPVSTREVEALRLANDEARRPFNLAAGPLLRLSVLRLHENDHMLLATMHHIISDGWSLGVFTRELAALYEAFSNGKSSPLTELPLQYADFAAWQKDWLQGAVLQKQLAYWKQKLTGVPLLLELPTDRPRPAAQTYRGARQHFTIPRRVAEEIRDLTQREGATLFMTLMAAFQTLLHRYCKQEQLIVSTAIANRNQRETESLIGCLINMLLLRGDFAGNPTFRELLGQVRETALEAYAHQDLPFEKLVEELQPARDLSYNPLTQVMFVLLNAPKEHLELPGLEVKPLGVETGATQYDIIVHMFDTAEGLAGFVDFSTDLFDGETIARLFQQFEQLLTSVVANPDERVESLPLLPPSERRRLLVEWNGTGRAYARERCAHELFAAQAARVPAAVALEFEGTRWTYAELNARANQLARHLQALGVRSGALVGLCVERSLDMVAGLLGVWKAGGAYVPLDPAYPQERLNFMLADAQAPVLVTQAGLAKNFSGSAARVVCVDADWAEISQRSAENFPSPAQTEDLAYVIYTSGSTG
ncbi:MAG: SDR family NAD(P)-dependent oxidoreductase, partial [Verrucomicrobia bacterium]|nr:SDR family NAD(P)-dependent oxidoreductase [Verrucomicrobiota bacterium]